MNLEWNHIEEWDAYKSKKDIFYFFAKRWDNHMETTLTDPGVKYKWVGKAGVLGHNIETSRPFNSRDEAMGWCADWLEDLKLRVRDL